MTEILLLLGPEADLTQLRLYAETSERATSDVNLNYKKVLDLSDWVTITLTAEDGTTRAYRIKATKNTYASIAAFSISIGEERYNGTIDHDKGQILIQGVHQCGCDSSGAEHYPVRWHDPLHSSERNGAEFHQSGRLHRDR